MNHSEIVSFLWGVADLIRDTFKRGKYQDVILPLTVLRRLDCVLADTRSTSGRRGRWAGSARWPGLAGSCTRPRIRGACRDTRPAGSLRTVAVEVAGRALANAGAEISCGRSRQHCGGAESPWRLMAAHRSGWEHGSRQRGRWGAGCRPAQTCRPCRPCCTQYDHCRDCDAAPARQALPPADSDYNQPVSALFGIGALVEHHPFDQLHGQEQPAEARQPKAVMQPIEKALGIADVGPLAVGTHGVVHP